MNAVARAQLTFQYILKDKYIVVMTTQTIPILLRGRTFGSFTVTRKSWRAYKGGSKYVFR